MVRFHWYQRFSYWLLRRAKNKVSRELYDCECRLEKLTAIGRKWEKVYALYS